MLLSLIFKKNKCFSTPVHTFDDTVVEKMELKYYNSDMHKASFVLPTAFQKVRYFQKISLWVNKLINFCFKYYRFWTIVLKAIENRSCSSVCNAIIHRSKIIFSYTLKKILYCFLIQDFQIKII